jgi:hypothetical protein
VASNVFARRGPEATDTLRPRGGPHGRTAGGIFLATVLAASLALHGCGSSGHPRDGAATDGATNDSATVDRATSDRAATDSTAAAETGREVASTPDVGRDTTPATGDLGKPCLTATDCAGGLTCLAATSTIVLGTEGPPGGLCTLPCNSDTTCTPQGGVCLNVAADGAPAMGYCFQTCTFGDGDATKCHARNDFGCLTIGDATTGMADVCLPSCSQDSDCPAPRKCDVGTGFCADAAPAGDPLGTHCAADPDSGTSACASVCLPIAAGGDGPSRTAHYCTMPCVLGNSAACNFAGTGMSLAGGAHGFCALSLPNADTGDIGFCIPECDATADCADQADPGESCDTSVTQFIGHGVCSF